MTLQDKRHAADLELEAAIAAFQSDVANPETWRALCAARGRVVALANCGGR
jgi:hypothetical protein